MTDTKHTPGPRCDCGGEDENIHLSFCPVRVFAETVDAFESFVNVVDKARDYTPGRSVMDVARAAIARAKGEKP